MGVQGKPIDLELDGQIPALNSCNWSSRRISRFLPDRGHKVSARTVLNVVGNKTKAREARSQGKEFKGRPPRLKLTEEKMDTLRTMVTSPNPPSQAEMGRRLGVSAASICRAIKSKLKLTRRIKLKVHYPQSPDKRNRRRNSEGLLQKMDNMQLDYFVTFDEALMTLSRGNGKTPHCYLKRDDQLPDTCLMDFKENYPKSQMVVGVMTGRGTLPLVKIPINVKINQLNLIDYILRPLFLEWLPQKYRDMSQIFLHFDKASVHTGALTTAYLECQSERYGFQFLRKEDIIVKGADVSPLDFYGFGYLKQQGKLSTAVTLDDLFNEWNEAWSIVPPDECITVFKAMKRRLGTVVEKEGGHIEHVKTIHQRQLIGVE